MRFCDQQNVLGVESFDKCSKLLIEVVKVLLKQIERGLTFDDFSGIELNSKPLNKAALELET
jgi:hypothetical protein